MSTYVMSDLHGNDKGYHAMLEKIGFVDDDMLYMLGDIVDRGDGGIRILQDMMLRLNVIPILGNHEYMMVKCTRFLLQEMTEESVKAVEQDPGLLQGLIEWMNVGGSSTISEIKKASPEEREELLDYLNEFSLYETVRVNGKEFVMVHAGLCNFDPNRSLDDYQPWELIFKAPNYGRVYFPDKYLVTGHLPTRVIWADGELTKIAGCRDDIYMRNNHIAIDCASGFDGGRVGCLRLDDMREFYVYKEEED